MISAMLTFQGENAEAHGQAIGPDNLPEMVMKAEGETLRFNFRVEKIGTLMATIDDLLMNLRIAEETLVCGEER